jgi:hypothetical protein
MLKDHVHLCKIQINLLRQSVENFSTYSFDNLKQDHIVQSPTQKKKIIFLLTLEMAILECFL